jgi:hypothetical protein
VEPHIRAQTARPRRRRLQRTVARGTARLGSPKDKRVCNTTQVETQRKEALLPRSHHPPPQGNERPPRNVHPPAHKRLIPEIGGLGCRMIM